MNFFQKIGLTLLNVILPPNCPVCGKKTAGEHDLCSHCYTKIHFITKPYCQCCGRPYEFKTFDELICGACLQKRPLFHKARAAFTYDDFSKKLILPFKHGRRTELAPFLVQLLIRVGNDLIKEADVIIPVPLHRFRLMKRGYNQAALLAGLLAKKYRKHYAPDVLKRIKHTKSQGHLSPSARAKNLQGAFHIVHASKIKNKRILLIDDVMTSGATVNACTKILLKNGAKQVDILTLARVIK